MSAHRAGAPSHHPQGPGEGDDAAERLRFFLVRLPVGALVLNPGAEIVDCNPTALNLLRLTRDRVIGRQWSDIGSDVIHEDGTAFTAETGPVPEAIRERRMIGGVIVGLRRPCRDDRVWLEVHAHPRLSGKGELRELVLLFRDITEHRLRQAAERQRDEAERQRAEAERQRETAERRAEEAERRRREDAERQVQTGRLEQALPGTSPAAVRLRSEIQEAVVALDDLPVLILGEPGTGKTLVARTLHDISSRRGGRFEPVDCSSISPSLFESEVFGHEKGAFTGATASLPGRFELADGGTLFLDEVGDFPLEQQPKLLVALQEHRVRRLGAKADLTVDIAVIAATNHDLRGMVAEGRFRTDLYDRLNGVVIHLPPLRDRRDDLGILVDRFARAAAERRGTTVVDVDAEILTVFRRFDWPGNVRQLQQVVQRMVGRAKGDRLTADLVPDEIRAPQMAGLPRGSNGAERLRSLSKEQIEAALATHENNVRRTAASVGVSRTRLYRLMAKYGVTPRR